MKNMIKNTTKPLTSKSSDNSMESTCYCSMNTWVGFLKKSAILFKYDDLSLVDSFEKFWTEVIILTFSRSSTVFWTVDLMTFLSESHVRNRITHEHKSAKFHFSKPTNPLLSTLIRLITCNLSTKNWRENANLLSWSKK